MLAHAMATNSPTETFSAWRLLDHFFYFFVTYRFECRFNQFFLVDFFSPPFYGKCIRFTQETSEKRTWRCRAPASEAANYNEIRVVHTSFVNLIIPCHCQLSIFVRIRCDYHSESNGDASIWRFNDFCWEIWMQTIVDCSPRFGWQMEWGARTANWFGSRMMWQDGAGEPLAVVKCLSI